MATKRTSSKAASETKSLGKTSSKRQTKPTGSGAASTIKSAHAAVAEGTTFLEQVKRAEQQAKTVQVRKVVQFFRNPDGSVGEQAHVYPGDAEAYDLLTNGGNWPRTFSDEKLAQLMKDGYRVEFV